MRPLFVLVLVFFMWTSAVEGNMTIGEFVTINSFIIVNRVGPLIGFRGLISIVQKRFGILDRITDFTSTNRVN